MPESAILGQNIASDVRGAYNTIKQLYAMHWKIEDRESDDFPIGQSDGVVIA